MADGSRHRLSYIEEVTRGTTPATPAFQIISHKGSNLELKKTPITSDKVRSDRQMLFYTMGTSEVPGDIDTGGLTYGEYDSFFESALGGAFTALTGTVTDTTVTAANAIGATSIGVTTAASTGAVSLSAGDIITIAGDSNKYIVASAVTIAAASSGTITIAAPGLIVATAGSEAISVPTASAVAVGTTRKTFSVEDYFEDLDAGAKAYQTAAGVEITGFDMSVGINKPVDLVFHALGLSQSLDTGIIAGATYLTAASVGLMESFTGSITEGGAAIATVTEVKLKVDNSVKSRFVLNSATGTTPAIGLSNVTGEIVMYFDNTDIKDKFLANTSSSLEFTILDASGNEYVFNLPNIVYNAASSPVSGQGDILLTLPFQALYDSTTGTNLKITRA